jgi:hypothetical protein
MLFAFRKVGINKISILIIFVFWEGIFNYSFSFIGLSNAYKIIIVLYALYLAKFKFYASDKNAKKINIAFIFFTIFFWLSFFFNKGEIVTLLSQYLYKFSFTFIVYHYFKRLFKKSNYYIEYVKRILLVVLFAQIFLSIVKISLAGFGVEKVVGSMSAGGAGLGVVMPVMFLIFYWVIKDGNFKRTDWIIMFSILFIGIASAKRQPIVFFPIILFALFSFVKGTFKISSLIIYIPLVIFIFYIGIRLTPTLTPEGKVGGSFNLNYFREYSLEYYFGTSSTDDIFSERYDNQGRGGGITYYFHPKKLNLNSIEEILFGKGLYDVAVQTHGLFTATGESDYGIEHGGLIGEAAALLYSLGYFGVLTLLFMAIFIIRSIKYKKLALILMFFYLWDFLFYYNQVIYSNQSIIIILFILYYTNAKIPKAQSSSINPVLK